MFEVLKKLLHTLNDIRVLLNNSYSVEYVLEALRFRENIQSQII